MHRFVGSLRQWTGCSLLVLSLLAGACSHGEPFDLSHPVGQTPFSPDPPIRLTLSGLDDRYPAWNPDGSGLVYSYGPGGGGQRDRCLGELPPGGGQIGRSRCYRLLGEADSTDVLEEASPWTRDEIAWVEHHSFADRVVADYGAIMVGSLGREEPPTRLIRLPYLASSGHPHVTATHLRWLSADRLVYVGADVLVQRQCQLCKLDTIMVPKDIVLLDRHGGPPVVLPNSEAVTSLWPTADSTGLYYSLAGDARVWRRDLAGGAPVLVHDFGGAGIARDVSVVGNRLVAVVGGNVFYTDAEVGPRQIDNGGFLRVVDLASGAIDTLGLDSFRFRRPVLSPDGRAVVVEGFRVETVSPDLYLFTLE
jgi:hypothetical protein